jgi:hypothetical protein
MFLQVGGNLVCKSLDRLPLLVMKAIKLDVSLIGFLPFRSPVTVGSVYPLTQPECKGTGGE